MSPRLWQIGRDVQSRVKGFFENPPGPDATPLELLQATLDELERKVQPAGRGRRVFPYDRIVVRIAQAGADPIAVDAIFSRLERRLRDRLEELQCESPESIVASVALVEAPGDEGQPLLTVDCFREPAERPASAPDRQCPSLKVSVIKGQCAEPEYVFEEPTIAIGRMAEATDAFGQIRVNHVPFLDLRDGVNETVGRAHARLQFDAASGHYNLFNEGSSNPTSIVRGGRTIRVAPRDPRGVRVQSGDQVQLGRAILRLTVG
ncbi:MAG: FHA domain-containing protein [Vicinamibacterales bacterium]